MYRWTDPIDPDDASRRPAPPTDEGPAWLTDRPEPRSSYLFGDEPPQPPAGHLPPTLDAGRYGDVDGPGRGPVGYDADPTMTQPGYGHAAAQPDYGAAQSGYDVAQPGYGAAQSGYDAAGPGHGHGVADTGHGYQGPFESAGAYPPDRDRWNGEEQRDRWNGEEQRDRWNGEEQPAGAWAQPATAWQPVTDTPPDDSRHRLKRRLSRPLVIGGAAAAATLVVSLGVGAVLLPGGDDRPAERTAADAPAAVAPFGAEQTESAPPADALVPGSASPTAVPTTVKPSPTKKATPRPSRTKAPSRQLERSSAPSNTGARTTSSGSGLSSELQQVVDLVNQERAKAGCKALTVNSKLTLAAQRHSQDQADHKKMSHDGSDGSDVGQRLDRVGYTWRAYGENVAWNQQSPAAVMDAWMNSAGHRANILNCSFTQIGVGVARSNGPYWTQDFGTPR